MKSSNLYAFKEWAATCEALAAGRQTLIVRKGGIQEGSAGFRVEHREFWLFPTYLHQDDPGVLVDEAAPLLARAKSAQPADDEVVLSLYADVEEVHEVQDEACLARLEGLQILSPRALSDRFHYRRRGLFILLARIYRLPETLVIPNSPHFAGCRSWVDFPRELSTAGLVPVLSDEEFARQREWVRAALAPVGWA